MGWSVPTRKRTNTPTARTESSSDDAARGAWYGTNTPTPAPTPAPSAHQAARDAWYGVTKPTTTAESKAQADFNEMYSWLLNQQQPGPNPNNNTNGSGRRYGGGATRASLDALMAKLTQAGDKDRAAAKAAYGAYDQYAAGLSNPWEKIGPAQQAQVDPSVLANLIQSQGGGDAGLRAQAQFLQGQNAATAGASDRLAQQMAANQAAWNQSARGQGQLAAAGADSEFAAQLLQLQAMIEAKKAGL